MAVRIELGDIQETLLIPLYGRALDACPGGGGILRDRRAAEFVDEIDYDFTRFSGPSLAGSVLRATMFDGYVRAFLDEHPDGVVADLGCGLSTRFDRLDNGSVRWFDLDVPDTMALRRRFFDESERYTMVGGSILDDDWHAALLAEDRPVLLLSEAVLLYFDPDVVEATLRGLRSAFAGSRLALDTGGSLMMRTQDRNPVFASLPARMTWTCDDPQTLAARVGMGLCESRTFAQAQPAVRRRWPRRYRWGLRALAWTPPVRSYRVNLFSLDG